MKKILLVLFLTLVLFGCQKNATDPGSNQTYKITVSVGANGAISPGTSIVNSGTNLTYTITPSSGYSIATLTVDGVTVPSATSYTFTNIVSNHTISATFTQMPVYTITSIVVVAGGGTITPTSASVISGNSASFAIAANATFHLDSLWVDGHSVTKTNTYVFSNVTANHTLKAFFSDVLSKKSLDSLSNLLVGQWTMTSLNSSFVTRRNNSALGYSALQWDVQSIRYYCSSNVYSQYYSSGVYVPDANLSGSSCSPLNGQQFRIYTPNHWMLKNNGKVIYMTDWPLDSLSNITVTKDSLIAFYLAGPNAGNPVIAYKYHYARVTTLTNAQINSLVNNLSGVNFIDVLDSTYYYSGTTGSQWQAATLPPGDTFHWAFTVTSTAGGIISGTYQQIKPDNTVSLTNVSFSISADGKMITLYNNNTKVTSYIGIVELTPTKFVYIAYNYPYGNSTIDIEFVAKRY